MVPYVLHLDEIDKTSLPYVGGKGANLGEMIQAGFPVPDGFCVTTAAYRSFIDRSEEMAEMFTQLDSLDLSQLDSLQLLGKRIRTHLLALEMPDDIRSAVLQAWKASGTEAFYAIRSSATAEDLPTASFAGQQDTYLNIKGEESLLKAIQKCWASLFTDRAISYRIKNGFDHRSVYLSVVVQQMVFPEVSGIMFTADPISGHRKTISIDASFGLGEALVSGLVSADLYQVRSGNIVKKQIAEKKIAIDPLPEGGTITRDVPADQQTKQALSDEKIRELAQLGKRIEQHYGAEQDIEWGLADGKFFILQSRPVTSLFPLPKIQDDGKLHFLFSFGHQQMMTEAMKPLALSIWRTLFPFGKRETAAHSKKMVPAGGRLFIDLTEVLYWKPTRKILPIALSNIDEVISNACRQFVQRERFRKEAEPSKAVIKKTRQFIKPVLKQAIKQLLFRDPSQSVQRCDQLIDHFVQRSEAELSLLSGPERIRWIQEHAGKLLYTLFQQMMFYPLSGVVSFKLIQSCAKRWLGDDRDVHLLNKSLPGNVTSEMGLALGDLADLARKEPAVVEYLKEAENPSFYNGLTSLSGAEPFREAFAQFINRYGMRCPGEIDITKLRWREAPTMLVPSLLSHLQTQAPGEHREKFRQGEAEAEQACQSLLTRVRKTRGGWWKQKVMAHLINVFRGNMGTREHPKYIIVRHLDLYKRAIMDEAHHLTDRGILNDPTDVFYLTLAEIRMLVEGSFTEDVHELIERRKKDHERNQKLAPPRNMTSEGEVITGRRADAQAPAGALLGTPVSPGVVEGKARVVLNPEKANLNPGEILIAPFTDPGWTTLFHSSKALVMEVGGLMTHGAVVAREYGIPAVVGVDGATTKIKDGQMIRVNGTEGYVQILEEPPQTA